MPPAGVPTASGAPSAALQALSCRPPSAYMVSEIGAEPQDAPASQHSTLGTWKRVCKLSC